MQHLKDTRDFIREKRLESGKSLNGFSFDAGIEPASLSRIENKTQGVKLDTLVKVASQFDMKLSDFFKELENKGYKY